MPVIKSWLLKASLAKTFSRKNWKKKERERDIYTVNGKKKFLAQMTLMYQN